VDVFDADILPPRIVRDIGSTMTVNVFLLPLFSLSLAFSFSFSIGAEVGDGDNFDSFSPPYRSGEAINGEPLTLAFSFSFPSPANASALFPLPKTLVKANRSVLDFPFLCPFDCDGDAGD